MRDAKESLELAFAVAGQFGLKQTKRGAFCRIAGLGWRDCAAAVGLTAKGIARMETSFEHKDLRMAWKPANAI